MRDATVLDLDSVDSALNRAVLERYRAASVAVRVWDVTSDMALPCFIALAVAPDGGVEAELGSGCHADREIALARALTEAAQARLTRISGARDDFAPEGYDLAAKTERQATAREWLRTPARRLFAQTPSWAGATLRHDLDIALARLHAARVRQVAYVDLTQEAFGVPVARVIVPGLEGPWTPDDGAYTPGPRARAAV